MNEVIFGRYLVDSRGPVVALELTSTEASKWLKDYFVEVARTGRVCDLAADGAVQLVGVHELKLARVSGFGPIIEVKKTKKKAALPGFLWTASPQAWYYLAELVSNFSDGRSGSYYLSRQGLDDVLVEVSRGGHEGGDR